MADPDVHTVRRFSRTVSQRIGVLDANYLDTGRALVQARLLFEIGEAGCTVRDLRQRLGFDPGYLSRLLRALEDDGLLDSAPDGDDARVRRVTLSARGRAEWRSLDQRSAQRAQSLIASLTGDQRKRLLAAMTEVERFLRAAGLQVELADANSPPARACVDAYIGELQQRFKGGFDPAMSVSADPDELVPPGGYFFLAWLDGEAVGCVALKVKARCGELKRMWVAPQARGLGIAQRMLQTVEALARDVGVEKLRLDTNRSLTQARSLYLANGYVEIPAYNDNPYADHWFEKRL